MKVQDTTRLPPSIRKQLPQAVMRKVREMDEMGQLDFAEEFRRRRT